MSYIFLLNTSSLYPFLLANFGMIYNSRIGMGEQVYQTSIMHIIAWPLLGNCLAICMISHNLDDR